jgi:stalled ribosome rescue protein Dom34
MKQEQHHSPQLETKRKTQVGVWIDHHQAVIVAAPTGEFAISRSIGTTAPEHHRSSEHTMHNAEQHLKTKHYHAVATHLTGFDHILLFGPGTAQEEMLKLLNADTHFRQKKIAIDSAGHMTDNQLVAKVRDFFEPS